MNALKRLIYFFKLENRSTYIYSPTRVSDKHHNALSLFIFCWPGPQYLHKGCTFLLSKNKLKHQLLVTLKPKWFPLSCIWTLNHCCGINLRADQVMDSPGACHPVSYTTPIKL